MYVTEKIISELLNERSPISFKSKTSEKTDNYEQVLHVDFGEHLYLLHHNDFTSPFSLFSIPSHHQYKKTKKKTSKMKTLV